MSEGSKNENIENQPPQIFGPETESPEQKRERILRMYEDLIHSVLPCLEFNDSLPGTEEYTLTRKLMGSSSTENSPATVRQLLFTLAFSEAPLVQEMARSDYKIYPPIQEKDDAGFVVLTRPDPKALEQAEKFRSEMRSLIESKVLSGLKILDLGCGSEPTFSRVARAAGADVWTVDLIGTDQFEYEDKSKINPKTIEIENEKHIKLDLADPRAVEKIQELTGGNFDITTEGHLHTPGYTRAFEGDSIKIGMALLKKGGAHFVGTPDWRSDEQPPFKE